MHISIDLNICGPLYTVDHCTHAMVLSITNPDLMCDVVSIFTTGGAYALTVAALTNNTVPFSPSKCNTFTAPTGTSVDFSGVAASLQSLLASVTAILTSGPPQPTVEVPLKVRFG